MNYPNNDQNKNGWNEWKRLLLHELQSLSKNQDRIFVALDRLNREVAGLQIKAGVWGVMGGIIPVAVAIAVMLLKN